jgi:hypothetical protein
LINKPPQSFVLYGICHPETIIQHPKGISRKSNVPMDQIGFIMEEHNPRHRKHINRSTTSFDIGSENHNQSLPRHSDTVPRSNRFDSNDCHRPYYDQMNENVHDKSVTYFDELPNEYMTSKTHSNYHHSYYGDRNSHFQYRNSCNNNDYETYNDYIHVNTSRRSVTQNHHQNHYRK